jgi:hypothetical protein
VASSSTHLWLGGAVRVDHQALLERPAADLASDVPAAVEELCAELLDDWEEDWAVPARRRHRLGCLDRLEELSRCLERAGRHPEALEVALVAVAEEPRRASAHRRVVEAHLAQGHVGEAVRHVHLFAAMLGEGADAPRGELMRLVERCSNVRGLGAGRRGAVPGGRRPWLAGPDASPSGGPDEHLARLLHPAGKRAPRSPAPPLGGRPEPHGQPSPTAPHHR